MLSHTVGTDAEICLLLLEPPSYRPTIREHSPVWSFSPSMTSLGRVFHPHPFLCLFLSSPTPDVEGLAPLKISPTLGSASLQSSSKGLLSGGGGWGGLGGDEQPVGLGGEIKASDPQGPWGQGLCIW